MMTDISVEEVNIRLREGSSIAQIERELGFGKDTLRKKLNRSGYKYDKELKQYITQDNSVCYKDITYSNTKSYKKEEKKMNQQQFTDDEVTILKQLIKDYKLQQNVESIDISNLKDKTITTRSFRSYKEVMQSFAKYCKDNKLNQVDAIAIALLDFIKK